MTHYSQPIEELWYLLLSLDNTWQHAFCGTDEVILINGYGQEVHANDEWGALQGAIALVGNEE